MGILAALENLLLIDGIQSSTIGIEWGFWACGYNGT